MGVTLPPFSRNVRLGTSCRRSTESRAASAVSASSGSPTNMPSTSGALHGVGGRRRGMRAEAEDRRAEMALQTGHRHDVCVEGRRRARKDNQRWPKAVALQACDDVIGRRDALRSRRSAGPRIRPGAGAPPSARAYRAAWWCRARPRAPGSGLTRERHAVDERRIDEERAPAEKVSSHQRTTVRGWRAEATPWGKDRPQVPATAPPAAAPADREDAVIEKSSSHLDVCRSIPCFKRRGREIADLDADERAELHLA